MRVDPDGAEVQVTAQAHGPAVVGGPDAGGEGVVDVVRHLHGFLLGAELLHRDDRTERFLLHDVIALLGAADDGGLEEEPLVPGLVAAGLDPAVVREGLHQGLDRVEVVDVVQRAEVVVFVVLRAGAEGLGVLHQGRHEIVVGGVLDQHPGDRGAVLAGVEEGELGDGCGALGDVGVGEHHGGGLAAKLEVGALEALRGAGGDGDAGPDGAGDGDQAGDLVLHHQGAGLAGAQDDVEHAGRENPAGEPGQDEGGFRGGVRGLEDHGVARGQGGADLPDGHQERVVPGRDLGDDADRFAPDVGGVALEVLSGGLSLQNAGGAGEEAQLVRSGGNFLGGDQGPDLAGVPVLGLNEFVAVCLDGVGELEQHQLALPRRRVLPALEGVLRGGHGGVDVGLTRDRRLRHDLAVGGVDDVQHPGSGRGDELAVDEVLQGLNHGVQPLSR